MLVARLSDRPPGSWKLLWLEASLRRGRWNEPLPILLHSYFTRAEDAGKLKPEEPLCKCSTKSCSSLEGQGHGFESRSDRTSKRLRLFFNPALICAYSELGGGRNCIQFHCKCERFLFVKIVCKFAWNSIGCISLQKIYQGKDID